MKVQEKKKRVVVLCLRPPQNVRLGSFTRVHVVTTAKKCSKKRDARVMLLFCILNLLLFCLSLPSPSSLLTGLPTEKLTTQVIVISFMQRGGKRTSKNDRNVICPVTLISDGHERKLDCLSFNQHVMVRCSYYFRYVDLSRLT